MMQNVMKKTKTVYYGIVVSTEDPLNEGRLKISIPEFDKTSEVFCKDIQPTSTQSNDVKLKRVPQGNINGVGPDVTSGVIIKNASQLTEKPKTSNTEVTDNPCTEVPWSISLMPKQFQVMPKEGEMCMVLIFDSNQPQMNRAWIGPLMSDKSKINFESSESGGDLLNSNVIPKNSRNKTKNRTESGEDLSKKGGFTGGFPEKLDIAIMSRNNADIVMPTFSDGGDNLTRNGEVLIRAGKFNFVNTTKNGKNLSLNNVNPGYLRLKVTQGNTTHTTLYSDYIDLVSYKNSDGSSGVPRVFNVNPIVETDEEIINFHNSLSPLVRGDLLVSFLELIRDYVKNHNHPYHQKPATNANSKEEIEKFDLKSIISPNIRIN
jgi:hypothetical protein